MTEDHCLSSLELIEFRAGTGPVASQEHVRTCLRCSALFATLAPGAEERYEKLFATLGEEAQSMRRMIEDRLASGAPTNAPRNEAALVRRSGTRTRTVLLSQFLREALEKEEWDLGSLAERVQVSTSLLTAFCDDVFDLTHRSDVDAIAQVLTILAEDPEEVARGPLWESLLRVPGGMIKATGSTEMLAGSSFAGVSEESRESDLFRDQVKVDRSEPARRQAAELYLDDVLAAL
jgi:hypothetical protein